MCKFIKKYSCFYDIYGHSWNFTCISKKSSSIVQHIPTYVELKSKFISTSMVPRYGTSPPQFQKLGGNNVGKCKNCFFSIMVIFYFISKLKVNSDQPSKKLYNQNSYYRYILLHQLL